MSLLYGFINDKSAGINESNGSRTAMIGEVFGTTSLKSPIETRFIMHTSHIEQKARRKLPPERKTRNNETRKKILSTKDLLDRTKNLKIVNLKP